MTPKAKHKPTPEQQEVIEALKAPESLMTNARAGCAKTTTLEMAAPQVKVPALALAFNKKIADDMVPRMPKNFAVKTLNSMGLGAWKRSRPQISSMKLDDKKLGKLITETARSRKMGLSSDQWVLCQRLAKKVMQAGITPGDIGEPLLADTEENWREIADQLWMTDEDFSYLADLTREVIERNIQQANQGLISFDDQIYCSVCLGGTFPKYPVVFVDEAQDLSPLNHAMLEKCLHPSGKIVAVGDEAQAIYAFRGASGDSMQRIRALRTRWIDRPLNTTFRCPKAVVARQQAHVPGFTAFETNREGRVENIERLEGKGWDWGRISALTGDQPDSVAVLCRNNAPLLALAFRLLRQQIGVVMLGRDIGKGLIALARKIIKEPSTPADVCASKITEWCEHEASLARANGQEEKADGIYDRAECLQAVLVGALCRDAAMLCTMLEKLFSRDTGLVTLSTIHRAKGLEWHTVLHLDPWRVPSKMALREADAGNPVPLIQEKNLKYVCETRTKNVLVNANLEDFE